MFKFYLIAALFFPVLSIFAQTQVSGNQSGTWSVDGSPYQVTGHIRIPSGQVLHIDAGVRIEFQGRYRIYVDGKLLANGTETDSIVFTAANHDSGWAGIRMDQTSDISEFYYCRFEYGKTSANGSYPDQHGGAVVLHNADAEFYHCVFENNDATGDNDGMGGAVYGINTGNSTQTRTRFEDCTFLNNHAFGEGGAVKLTNDKNTQFIRCKFYGNSAGYGGGALFFYTAENVLISQCAFYENTASNSGGGAVKTLNPQSSISFVNCTFNRNHSRGYAEGGAVDLAYADAVFTNCIIYNNTQQYGKDVHIGQNASAEFHFCDVDMPDNGTGDHNLDNLNPLFVDADRGDLHLQAGSPCIDAGTDVGLPYAGNAPDMGCYEFGLVGVEKNWTQVAAVYPIPADDILWIRRLHAGKMLIELLTLQGEKLLQKKCDSFCVLSVNSFSPGIYILRIQTENKTYAGRILIKK